MEKVSTSLDGAFVIKAPLFRDNRGTFNRLYCQNNLFSLGLDFHFVQSNICINDTSGILRGLHYQSKPHEETKLVTCLVGEIYDVIVDLRPNSPTYLQWENFILSCPSRSIYVPKGFAHGYQTLTDNAVVHYSVNEFYNPKFEKGLRYNDPKLVIKWPVAISRISNKDDSWPWLD